MFFDEPTAGLDDKNVDIVIDIISRLKNEIKTQEMIIGGINFFFQNGSFFSHLGVKKNFPSANLFSV